MKDGDRDVAVTSTRYLLKKVCQAGAVNHVSIVQDEVLGVGVACSKMLITIVMSNLLVAGQLLLSDAER